MFDHSCSQHDQGSDDGLNAFNMGVKWRGKQVTLSILMIIADDRFLGPHNPHLKDNHIKNLISKRLVMAHIS